MGANPSGSGQRKRSASFQNLSLCDIRQSLAVPGNSRNFERKTNAEEKRKMAGRDGSRTMDTELGMC